MHNKYIKKYCLNCKNFDVKIETNPFKETNYERTYKYELDFYCNLSKNNEESIVQSRDFKVPKECPYYLEFVLNGYKNLRKT